MNQPLVSVLMPVYNAEESLARSVHSVLAQTYANFELVLIDDGSTDGSGALCQALAGQDARIRVVAHAQNQGVAAARNTGVQNARGRYISWVDADDSILPTFLETLLGLCTRFDAAIAMCRLDYTHNGSLPTTPKDGVEPDCLMDFETFCENIYSPVRGMEMTMLCTKLYEKRLYAGEQFPPGAHLEDEYMTWRLVLKARGIAVSTKPLYYYTISNESIMRGGGAAMRRAEGLPYLDERLAYLESHGFARVAARARVSRQLILYEILQALGPTAEERALHKQLKKRAAAQLWQLGNGSGVSPAGRLRLWRYYLSPARFAKARQSGATTHLEAFLA